MSPLVLSLQMPHGKILSSSLRFAGVDSSTLDDYTKKTSPRPNPAHMHINFLSKGEWCRVAATWLEVEVTTGRSNFWVVAEIAGGGSNERGEFPKKNLKL